MKPLIDYTETGVDDRYSVTQPSVWACIGDIGVRRTTVIDKYAYTITTRPDRTPAQVLALGGGRYRYLTERECWRLQGFTDEQFDRARAVNSNTQLYKQAGNAVTVNVTYEIGKHFMAIFEGELN